MNAAIGLPKGLAAMGVSAELINDMVPHAVSDLSTRTNPKPVGADDYAMMFRAAM